MSEHHRHNFENRDGLMQRATDHITQSLQSAIERRGVALLAVSGGSTPKALFPLLAVADIEWQHVKVCLVDERWVEPDDEASNERLVRELLLVEKGRCGDLCADEKCQRDTGRRGHSAPC